MNVLIFGSGAVGLGIASCLIKSGVETTLLAGIETVNMLNDNGLKRTGLFGDVYAKPEQFTVINSLTECSDETYDFVLVCTKSNQTHIAAEEISKNKRILGPESCIVHFQNGWGNAEKFLKFFQL